MNNFPYKYKATGKDIDGAVELTFEDGPYEGITFTLSKMKFADEENEDGSINMSFDYDVTNNKEVDKEFEKIVGDLLIDILEKQIQNSEVVYKGGV